MRAKKCGMSDAEKEFRRLNYCGTCKTIGSLYGQKSRLLLNHDTVFLAEILTALGGENVSEWQKSYQSLNCLNLPETEMPKALQFAATTNIILAEVKLNDHIFDENKRRYKFARNAFSKEFQAAEKLLNEWNFPLAEVKEILISQKSRENECKSLEYLAFPTAQTTAVFFREGVKQTGKNEVEKLAFELGFEFGKLVYLLDAFEDYEKDFHNERFNAFRAVFELKESKFSSGIKRRISSLLTESEREIIAKIGELPITENQKSLFISRLSQNLHRKLKTNLPVLKTQKVCSVKPRQTFAQKWQNASEKARNLARQYHWQMPLVFLFIFIFALIVPAQSRGAKSARECFDLSFNLMFLGTVFGSVFDFPKILLRQENLDEKDERRRRWCDWCGSDCCFCDCGDGCDCCCECDSCDCGSCCDGCDCCSCD